jgi:hypothetical protein
LKRSHAISVKGVCGDSVVDQPFRELIFSGSLSWRQVIHGGEVFAELTGNAGHRSGITWSDALSRSSFGARRQTRLTATLGEANGEVSVSGASGDTVVAITAFASCSGLDK